MIVYRLSHTKYAHALSGEGARKQRLNRWNSYGTSMIYTSDSPALCALELSQHLPPFYPRDLYKIMTIELPDDPPLEIESSFYKKSNWRLDLRTTQTLGDLFIKEKKSLCMKVPSVLLHSCFNFLINPEHPKFKNVNILASEDFPLEGKIFA